MKLANKLHFILILGFVLLGLLYPVKVYGEEIPAIKGFVSNENIMGGGASIIYWLTNKTEHPIRVPLDWFYDGHKYLEIRSAKGVVNSMPGGVLHNNPEKFITIDSGAVVVILGVVPMNEVFLERRGGIYSLRNSILGDIIKPFKIKDGVISDYEEKEPIPK